MSNTTFLRDRDEAVMLLAKISAAIGRIDRYGRITETLMGAELTEQERGGRPLYRVARIVHNHDPLFDGNLSQAVRDARAAYIGAHG